MTDTSRYIAITRPLPGDPLATLAGAGFTNVWMNPRDERLDRRRLLSKRRAGNPLADQILRHFHADETVS